MRVGCYFNFVTVIWANYLIFWGLIFLWEKNRIRCDGFLIPAERTLFGSLSVVTLHKVLFNVIHFLSVYCIITFLMHFKVIQIIRECILEKYSNNTAHRLKSESKPFFAHQPLLPPYLTLPEVSHCWPVWCQAFETFLCTYPCTWPLCILTVFHLQNSTKRIVNLSEIPTSVRFCLALYSN